MSGIYLFIIACCSRPQISFIISKRQSGRRAANSSPPIRATMSRLMTVPLECLFIPCGLEDTGNGLFPAFLLQSISFAVATRRNDARTDKWLYIKKAPPISGGASKCKMKLSFYSLRTFSAAGPLAPLTTSKLTRSPSASDLKPSAWMAE